MAAAGGAGDPENDPNNPKGHRRGRRDPSSPLNGAGRGRNTDGQVSCQRSQRDIQHNSNCGMPPGGSNSGRPVRIYTQDIRRDPNDTAPCYPAGANNNRSVPAFTALPILPNLIVAPQQSTPAVDQLAHLTANRQAGNEGQNTTSVAVYTRRQGSEGTGSRSPAGNVGGVGDNAGNG